MKIKGYHRASMKFSDLTFDQTFNQSMELLNHYTTNRNQYDWNFSEIYSNISNSEGSHKIVINNGNDNPFIRLDNTFKRFRNGRTISSDTSNYFSTMGIIKQKSIRDETKQIKITKQNINSDENIRSTIFSPSSINGNCVSDYQDLISASGSNEYYTITDTPKSNLSKRCTPTVTYDSTTDTTTVSIKEEDVTLSRLANEEGNYILPENADIQFGEQYKASKERILTPLRTVHESIFAEGETYPEYYQDPYGINYIISNDHLVAIGIINTGTIGVTEVLPTWNRFSLFKRDDDTVPDHYDQLNGIQMIFSETSSSYEIVVPETCIAFIISNYYGKMDVSNCTITSWDQELIRFGNCNNGTLIISSEQAKTLGDRIVNGRLDDENGIQVEVKTE